MGDTTSGGLPFTDVTGGIGMNPLLFGMGGGMGAGQIMDPAWQGAMQRQRYAMGLLSGASDASPIRSPWQAVARGLSGVMGGLQERWAERSMADVAQRMQASNQAAQDQVNQTLQGLVGGVAQSQPSQISQPGQPPPAVSQAQPGDGDTIGARNRNPLNLRSAQGAPQSQGFAVFPTTAAGVRATASQLQSYQDNQGINTIRGLATRWVSDPKADMTSYVGDISKAVGVGPDDPINTHDPVFMAKYIQAAVPHESVGKSGNWVSPQDIQDGLNGVNLFGTTTGDSSGTGATGGPAPGSGFAAMIRIQQIAAQLMSNPFNPAGQAYGRSLMSMAPQLARIGASGTPQPIPGQPGMFRAINPVTGAVETQGTPQNQDVADMQFLIAHGNTPWNQMDQPTQQQYAGARARLGGMGTLQYDKDQGWQNVPSTRIPPNLTVPPGQLPGAVPGAQPGQPGGTISVTPPTRVPGGPPTGGAIEQTAQDSARVLTDAGTQQAQAQDSANNALASNQSIRALSTQTRPGWLSTVTAPAANIMQAFGISPQRIQQITGQDPTSAQLTGKQLFTLLGEKINQQGNIRAQALWERFEKALPSMESTGDTIDAVTRMYDAAVTLENNYANDRFNYIADMRNKFRTTQDPSQWDEKGLAGFQTNWFKQPQNDPRVWNAAALAATSAMQVTHGVKVANPDAWKTGLSTSQQAQAMQIAHQLWPSDVQYTPPATQGSP